MKTIEKGMVAAFNSNKDFHKDNTSVVVADGKVNVYLFGNKIASKDVKSGEVRYSNCGWASVTTSSRLHALGCDCRIKKGVMYDSEGNVFNEGRI